MCIRDRAHLANLRKVQDERYQLENFRDNPTDDEVLYQFRRYPWSSASQNKLRELANRELFAGHAQSAWRNFQDLLNHAADSETRDASLVGIWTARNEIETPQNAAQLLGDEDPDRKLSWLGKPTSALEICRELLKSRPLPPRQLSNCLLYTSDAADE